MAIEFIDVIFRTISSVRKKGESWTGYSILYNRVGGTGGWPGHQLEEKQPSAGAGYMNETQYRPQK